MKTRDERHFLQGLTHGNTQQANANLNACNDMENFQYAALNKPMVGSPCQGETKYVLEDQEACEGFDGDVPYFVVSTSLERAVLQDEEDLRWASTMYNALATAPKTIPMTSNA